MPKATPMGCWGGVRLHNIAMEVHQGVHLTQCSPSKAIDKEPDGKGPDHASDGEDGDGEGPERGEGGRADGLLVPVQPGTVVKILNHLQKRVEKQSHGVTTVPTSSGPPVG